MRRLCSILALPALVIALGAPASAQGGRGDIWSGVFTREQAARGRENFLISCDRCHAQDLSGLTAPALKGEGFLLNWEGGSLNRLFTKIRDTMPPNFGSPLTEEAKLEVLAFILETNGFPPGRQPLRLEAALLDGIQIIGQGGDLPNFSLVEVIGCMERGPGATWMLTRTTDPRVTGDPRAPSEELEVARNRELGTGAYRLVSVKTLEASARAGRKTAARGLLYRDEREALLNVTSLDPLGADCP